MAAQSVLPAPVPSGRYIRVYLLTWGVLAVGGLGYLASLAWQPELFKGTAPSEAEQPLSVANRALAEVGSVRRALDDVQKDLGQMHDALAERDTRSGRIEQRIASLEERVAQPVAAAPPAKAPDKVAEKVPEKVAEKAKGEISRAPAARQKTAQMGRAAPEQEAAPIETGSIGAPPTAISFGAPVVTPSKAAAYGVQLAAGPSREAIRAGWSAMLERHATELGALQPHIVPPRAEGGPFRLIAGPLPTKAEADKVCAALGLGRQGCFATAFIGEPL